jgi:hypothetical protein
MSGFPQGGYFAQAYIYRTNGILIDQIVFDVTTVATTMGYYGVFLGFLLLLVLAFAFKWNEIAGVWLLTIGCIFNNFVGLIVIGRVGITAVVLIAVIITFVLER